MRVAGRATPSGYSVRCNPRSTWLRGAGCRLFAGRSWFPPAKMVKTFARRSLELGVLEGVEVPRWSDLCRLNVVYRTREEHERDVGKSAERIADERCHVVRMEHVPRHVTPRARVCDVLGKAHVNERQRHGIRGISCGLRREREAMCRCQDDPTRH